MTEPRDPELMRRRVLDIVYVNSEDQINPHILVSRDAHATVCALLYVGDLLNETLRVLTAPPNTELKYRPTPDRPRRMPSVGDHEDLSPEALADLLALIGVRVTRDHISTWDVAMREDAAYYATAVHLNASDNPHIIPPERPPFLPPEGRDN